MARAFPFPATPAKKVEELPTKRQTTIDGRLSVFIAHAAFPEAKR